MKLEELVGQRLVIGIPGTRITPEIVRHFKELNAGGLILYRINFDSPSQIRKLIADLEEALGTAGKIDYARQQGEIEAKELRRLGLDVNLAPVLDVLTEAYSPNIGIRA